jgi:hypothetical protein
MSLGMVNDATIYTSMGDVRVRTDNRGGITVEISTDNINLDAISIQLKTPDLEMRNKYPWSAATKMTTVTAQTIMDLKNLAPKKKTFTKRK